MSIRTFILFAVLILVGLQHHAREQRAKDRHQAPHQRHQPLKK